MKPSRYTTMVDLAASGVRLAFNASTLALVEFRGDDVSLVDELLAGGTGMTPSRSGCDVLATLRDGGFLIDDDRDELAELEARNKQARFGNDSHLGLTIAPTLACNFRCTYCYETHSCSRMSEAELESLALWVERRTADGKDLSVTWFGGEPLLALADIERLSERFRSNAERLGRGYRASIVTNGLLLTREVAERLAAIDVREAQVTLDGPRRVHDSRRPLANGRGTFDTILANLRACHDLLSISLRINIDKNNAADIETLLDTLEEAGLRGRVYPYFGRVYPYTEVCADVQGSCFEREEFSLEQARLRQRLMERGFGSVPYPRLKGGFCTADSSHCMVIGPHGHIGKCWNDICDPQASVGHVSHDETPEMEARRRRWTSWNPFEKQDCRDCAILPICMGGCPYLAFQQDLFDRGECVDWKHNLREMIALKYLERRRREDAEIRVALEERMRELAAEGDARGR